MPGGKGSESSTLTVHPHLAKRKSIHPALHDIPFTPLQLVQINVPGLIEELSPADEPSFGMKPKPK